MFNTSLADSTLESLNAMSAGRLPGLVGFKVLEVGEEGLVCSLTVKPELLAPNGYLHAASVIALADTACGYGARLHLPEKAVGFTTVELKSNFLGTAREGVVLCKASPAHTGRTTQVWDARVYRADDDKTIALFRCTQMVIYSQ